MKKLSILTAAASALMLLASCTESTISEITPPTVSTTPSDGDAITFTSNVGKNKETRAGYANDITNDRLKDLNEGSYSRLTDGFGVFAYYTETNLYPNSVNSDNGTPSYTTAVKPNFMYNQQVTWSQANKDAGNITGWTYSPIKYWPNELLGDDKESVDDQNNDAADDPAQAGNINGSGKSKGGIVSYFAYAPYVFVTNTTEGSKDQNIDGASINTEKTVNGSTASGITALSGNDYAGNPTVSYSLATDGKNVDLLWGTKGNTSPNVNGIDATNNTKPVEYVRNGAALSAEPVNTNLTKQMTNGTIDFRFKHALAKVGGSNTSTTSKPNGLMVVLDLDDMKGAETGGEIEVKDGKTLTKVTIKSVVISTDVNGDGNLTDGTSSTPSEYAYQSGKFDLANGKWDLTSVFSESVHSVSTGIMTHTIDNSGTSAVLNTKLDEQTTATKNAAWFNETNTTDPGVTTTPQNVYNTEVSPLVFFPGQPVTLRFTIDYFVRTYDANLKNGFSQVEQVINKKVTFPALAMNKQYSVLMHIGLTSVKFTASVLDWETTKNTDSDGDGEYDLEQEDVYLPINVKGEEITSISITSPTLTSDNLALPNASAVVASESTQLSASLAWTEKSGSAGTAITNASDFKYEVISNSPWLTINGSNQYAVEQNTTNAARVARVKVTYKGTTHTFANPGESYEFTITQPAGFSITSSLVIANAANSESAALAGTINDGSATAISVNFTVEGLPSWLTYDSTNKKFKATTEGGAGRSADVTIKFTQSTVNYSGTITVTQAGS